jgi:hypothetical protein
MLARVFSSLNAGMTTDSRAGVFMIEGALLVRK